MYKNFHKIIAKFHVGNLLDFRLLTGMTIRSKEDVLEAMNAFHEKGVETVVLSSVELESSDTLQMFGSSVRGNSEILIIIF